MDITVSVVKGLLKSRVRAKIFWDRHGIWDIQLSSLLLTNLVLYL